MGILFDIRRYQHASEAAMKANRALTCMRRGFFNLNESILLRLYKSMIQPALQYRNIIWGPHYVLDQCKFDGVQWYATKLVLSLRDESHINQLISLNL